jgi:hypothetical protein
MESGSCPRHSLHVQWPVFSEASKGISVLNILPDWQVGGVLPPGYAFELFLGYVAVCAHCRFALLFASDFRFRNLFLKVGKENKPNGTLG